jgi:preprotein translocase subunit SecB
LNLTAEAKGQDGQIYFIVEIEQSGLFNIESISGEQLDKLLKIYCPNILFPYARQAIDSALNIGGFPPLMLAPLNFEQFAKIP